jgi:hypothetical protein
VRSSPRPPRRRFLVQAAEQRSLTRHAGRADALEKVDIRARVDKRRFLSAVFELLARGDGTTEHRAAAEFGLMAARLACLRNRLTGFGAVIDGHPGPEPIAPEAISRGAP